MLFIVISDPISSTNVTAFSFFHGHNWGEYTILETHPHHLVGGIPTPLKHMSSSLIMIIPNMWKKTFSKLPTSDSMILFPKVGLLDKSTLHLSMSPITFQDF